MMNKIITGAIVGAFAAGSVLVAAPAAADIPGNPSPWDFEGEVIELPFGGSLRIVDFDDDWGPNFNGVKEPRGADRSGPRNAGDDL